MKGDGFARSGLIGRYLLPWHKSQNWSLEFPLPPPRKGAMPIYSASN